MYTYISFLCIVVKYYYISIALFIYLHIYYQINTNDDLEVLEIKTNKRKI